MFSEPDLNRKHKHPHTHGRGHHHGLVSHHAAGRNLTNDHVLETSQQGIRALKISLAGLAATGGLQLVIFSASGSVSLLADLIHNLADALTALPLWVAFKVGRRSSNRRYTYGYGRAEDIAGIFIIAVIVFSAAVAGWESVRRLFDPQPMQHPGWVMAAALIGFAGNELVALYRIRAGRSIGSAALVADGQHARVDGIASLGVFVAAGASSLGLTWADPVVGLAITATILHVLKDAGTEIYFRLMDAVPPDLVAEAERLLATTPGIEEVEQVQLRWVGHRLRAEAKVTVDCDRTFVQAHAIAEEAHHRLLHDLPLAEAIIHPNPCSHHGIDHHLTIAHHFAAGSGPKD